MVVPDAARGTGPTIGFMRIDVVTIFPGYFDVLDLSLAGKARRSGLVAVGVHDLRDFTHDRHRTVDDTPYGGGAGMVMRPEPWGEALDALRASAPDPQSRPRLIVPSPAGRTFTQRDAGRLAAEPWLVFACGRYEGVDQRVVDHAASVMDVEELSIGDYVVNGGEVAALVMIEAVARLVPGFVGNPDSLVEESHTVAEGVAQLVEYPLFTKPPEWRGLVVPAVLRSGDHGRIAEWRRDQARARTVDRRPDLTRRAVTTVAGDALDVAVATPSDAAELLVLQRCCWLAEATANDMFDLPPLTETLDDIRRWISSWHTFVMRSGGRLVGAVRARRDGDVWEIGRLMVAPDLQGRGLGRWLLTHAEHAAPAGTTALRLSTGARSTANLRMYRSAGYRPSASTAGTLTLVKRVSGTRPQ